MTTANLCVRPFQVEDYLQLAAATPMPWCNLPRAAAEAARGGPAFTMTVDDRPAACAGLVLFPYPGVATAWAMIGAEARRHPRYLTRAVVRGLAALIQQYRLVRVEAEVVADFEKGREWVAWMGFEDEGLMRCRGPNGLDMIRYALLPKATNP